MQRPPPQASIPAAAGHKDTFQRGKRTPLCAPATDLNYRVTDPQAREGSARRPSFPHFMLKTFLTQAAPAGSSPSEHLLQSVFRGIHPTEDPSARDRALRPLSKAQRRPCATAPHRPRDRGLTLPVPPLPGGEGAAGEGHYLLGAVCSMPSPPRPPGAADRAPQAPPDPHGSGQTSPPLNTEPTTSHGRAPAAATTATSGRGRGPPPAPLIGYSRATTGADWVLWTSLSAAAARKPRPPRAERALPRRREGKIMEAAVLPSSRHASRGDGPRGTPGGVVRPRGVPASRAGRTGAPAALFRPRASFPRSGRCSAGQGRPRAAPPPEGRYIPAATAGRPSRSPARVRQARQRHPAPPQKVEVLVGERLQSSAEGSSKSVLAAWGSCSPQPPRVTRESFRGEKCRRWALGVWCQSTQVTLQGRGSCHVITQAAGFRLQSTM